MRDAPQHPDQPDHGGPHTAPDGSPLAAIDRLASDFHTATDGLLRQVCEALRWGGTQSVAGCTVRDYLTHEAGLPGWLAAQLESVARRLPAVPQVAELYAAGVLSFDQLAGFVKATRSFNGQLLARLDTEAASLAEQLAHEGRLHAFGSQVAFLVEELQAPGWRSRQEQRRERGMRWFAQQDFDGGGFVGRELDPVAYPTAVAAVMAETDPAEVRELGVQRARAEASVRIDLHYLAGTRGCHGACTSTSTCTCTCTSTSTCTCTSDEDGVSDDNGGACRAPDGDTATARDASGSPTAVGGCCAGPVPARPARPTVVWHVDIADATTDRFAQLLRAAGGGASDGRLVPVSRRLLATLADEADHVIALRQGYRPLDELAVDTDDVPAKTRRMVLRRDRGCRFPDCRRTSVQVHHIVPRSRGGTHSPDNLLGACALHHLRYVHRLGWEVSLDPTSGLVTWTNTRTGTTLATKPNGHRPAPARDPALLPDWLAPPQAPPPVNADPPLPDDQLVDA